jgi:predicted aspartyl protease
MPGRTSSCVARCNRGRRWVLAAVLQSGAIACAFAGDLTVPPPKNQISDIPFTLYRGYLIVVDGRLGNLEHRNLLIDTGTSPSMIDKSVSAQLRLQGTTRGLSLFNKSLTAESVTLPDVQIGPLHRRDLPVIATDFSKVEAGLGTHIDAVIGLDVLGTTSFTIDYQKRRISFHASLERYSASFTTGQQFITVDLKAGNRQLHLLLDTGTPHLVLFRRALHNLDYDWTALTGTGQNISGEVSYGTIILPQTRFGSEDVGPQRASVVASQQNIENDYDGLIGLSLLHPKRLSFDFDREVLGWSN